MQIEYLSEFVTLANYLNFSETAILLNISQPTLSRHILQMEEELGVKLLIRDKQSVNITPFGKIFLKDAKLVLRTYQHMFDAARSYQKGMQDIVKVGHKGIFDERWIEMINAFRKYHPNVEIKMISFEGFDEIYAAINGGEIDLALTVYSREWNFDLFDFEVILESNLLAVMSQEHSLAHKKRVTVGELMKQSLLFPDRSNHLSFPDEIFRRFQRLGADREKLDVTYSKNFSDSFYETQANGKINVIPDFLSVPLLGIKEVPIEGTEGAAKCILISRKARDNIAAEMLKQHCHYYSKKHHNLQGKG